MTHASEGQFLMFRLGGTEFAFPIAYVREITPYITPTRVPGTPETISGVVNIHGSIVPVVDLSVKFGIDGAYRSGIDQLVDRATDVLGEDEHEQGGLAPEFPEPDLWQDRDRTTIVVVETMIDRERTTLGVVVDSIGSVVTIKNEDIRPAPAFGASVGMGYLAGVGKLESGGFVLIFDVARTLTVEELMAFSDIADAELASP